MFLLLSVFIFDPELFSELIQYITVSVVRKPFDAFSFKV